MLLPDNHLYEFGNFVLDARSRILLNDGTTVRLTPKAFETLLVLIRNGVQVVDKDQLMKEVWPDTFVEEGSLSRNIYELRKALGDDPSEPRYIETIPKRGYRFLAPVRVSAPAVPQIDPLTIGGEATIIEKHTFARVVSDDVGGSDLLRGAKPISSATRLLPAGDVVGRKRKNILAAAAVAALVLTVAIGTFVLKRRTQSAAPSPPASRARNTLVRLTNNNAWDAGAAWSPDGKRIAFCSNRDGKSEIYVMNADGSDVKRVTDNLSDDFGPQWSPDGKKLLFDSERDGNKEIYVMDADGGNQTRLTRNNETDSATSWSPDGSQIAFASNRDNGSYNYDIYVMNTDGSNVRKIVNDPEYDAEPKWSPDGRKLLFVTGRNGNFDVYETNIDGTEQQNLTADYNKNDGAAAWSRDGKSIVFVRNIQGKEQIFLMSAQGGNLIRLTNNTSNNGHPALSPDGSKVAFESDRDGNSEIFVMSVDGELVQLTDDPADDLDPDWSPDGSKIAFSSNRAGMHHIYIVNADGTSPTQVTNAKADDSEPAWSRDGKRIAFVRAIEGNTEIYVVNTDGSNETQLTFDATSNSSPSWSPDGRISFTSKRDGRREVYAMNADGSAVQRFTTIGGITPVWSPDGSKIAFVSENLDIGKTQHPLQVFVANADGSNIRNVTKESPSTFFPCWSGDSASVAYNVDNVGVVSNIYQVDLNVGTIKRLTAGPKVDTQPAISPDGSKLAFETNRDGNFEIYVMNLR